MSIKRSIKFAKLTRTMVYSRAYQSLNAPSLKMLSYLLLQLRWVKVTQRKTKDEYVVENKNEIKLPYSIFRNKPFKMGNQTITNSIDSLLARGFIKIISQGGMAKHHVTIYGYSHRWSKWEEGEAIFKRKPFYRRGFCV